jgi:quinol monooxygenase YgiN
VSVTVIAQYRAASGSIAEVRAALRQMIEPTRAEPGCLAYDVYLDPTDDAVAVLVERYDSNEAFDAHLASEHFERLLRGTVLPRLAERVRLDLVPLEETTA